MFVAALVCLQNKTKCHVKTLNIFHCYPKKKLQNEANKFASLILLTMYSKSSKAGYDTFGLPNENVK